MATCQYCEKSAGMFREAHKACKEIHQNGVLRVQTSVLEAIAVEEPATYIQAVIDEVAPSSFLEDADIGGALVEGWNQAAEAILEQGPIDSETEGKFVDIQNAFEYSQDDLDERGNFTKLAQSAIIREVLEGNIEEITGRVRFAGDILFNFQKSEELVWLFNDVTYCEIRSQTRYIVSFQPYSDGLGIQRDAARAKPQIFQTVDGWFIYNLVTNLAQA